MIDNKGRIVHIAECAGGVDRYLEMLMPLLADEYQQFFICSQQYNVSKYEVIVDEVEQINLQQSFSLFRILSQVRKIRRLLKTIQPEIVYCHSSFAGGVGRLACIGMPCKVVYNPHGWAFNIKSRKSLVYAVIEKILSFATDQFICISHAEYESAVRMGIDKGKRLMVIENGISVRTVQNAKGYKRNELRIPDDAFVVGMIGRLTAQKAPDTFIRAARLINEKISNTYYIIVGNGEEEEKILAYAKEHNIHLHITGWTDQPYSYLKLFNVAVLLSRWEGFGLAIAEYMAAEKNIVATRVDAIPTLIDEGIDGELVNVDAPQEVADKVYYYYTHPVEAEVMRKKAKEKVINRFDVSRVAQQHKDLFRRLIECL